MITVSTSVTRRYLLQHKLGEGGMGEVYAALDRLTGTSIALKRVLYKPTQLLFKTYFKTDNDQELRRALADEFHVLASLRHPHIISVLDYGFDADQYPYYTMTLLATPQDILEVARNFSVEQRINAFAQMMQALAYLHRHGILHRDLKPGNVLMDSQNNVKLVDFGLATRESGIGTSGTLTYMAPEIIQDAIASPQSDLYAAGILAYEMFAGFYPYQTANVNDLLHLILHHMPDMQLLPPAVQSIIARLLMKDPADRYPDAESVLTDLTAAASSSVAIEDTNVRDSFLQAARFVGREQELGLLTQTLDRMMQASHQSPSGPASIGAAYLVGGESGTGKSRLLDELQTHALLNGALVLRGQGVTGNGLPFQMWRNVVRRLLLEQEVTDLEAGILCEIVPDIAVLLEREITFVPNIGAVSTQSRLIETIISLFQRQTQAMLLILEDLQWAFENLIPLKRLLAVRSQMPLLIVGSYRREEAITLPNQLSDMQVINLGRLTINEIAELSAAMIGASGQQPHLVDYLFRQSEGNALFLVEVVRALADDVGNLRGIGSRTLPPQVFAGGIQRIIEHRLSHLPAEAVPTLQMAAVVGRMLDLNLIDFLVGSEAMRWLQAALEAAILHVVDNQWRFAHDRLRDAVLATLSDSDRPVYHQRIAHALETLYPDDTGLAPILYDHWRGANDNEKAASYAVKVTQQRVYLGILNEAQQMLEQALALNPQDSDVLLILYDTAGEICFDLGKPQLSSEYYVMCYQLAQSLGRLDRAGRALEGMGNAAYTIGQYELAQQWYQQSLALRRSIGDERGTASTLHAMSILYRFWGDYEQARTCLDESLALRRKVNDQRGLADSLYQLSVNARNQGQYQQGIVYLEEGRLLRLSIGDKRGLADDLNSLGLCYMMVGDFEQAQAILRECLTIRRSVNNLRGAASVLNALSDLELLQGHLVPALRYAGDALSLWCGFQERWNVANSHAAQGVIQLWLNERHSARYHLVEAMRLAKSVGAAFVLLKALIGWARLLLLDEQPGQVILIIGMLENHPAMTAQLRQIHLIPLLSRVDLNLYLNEYALGKDFDLNTMIGQLLKDELHDTSSDA